MKKHLIIGLVFAVFVAQAGRGPFIEPVDELEFIYTVEGGSAVLRGINPKEEMPVPEKLEIPKKLGAYSVTEIGAGAFTGTTNLTAVVIPVGVTEISDVAFAGCENLTSVSLPEGVVKIGAGAFARCGQLKVVEIPRSVVEIGAGAFGESALKQTPIEKVRVNRGDEERVKTMLEESGFDAGKVEFSYRYDKITLVIYAIMGVFMLMVLLFAWRRRK